MRAWPQVSTDGSIPQTWSIAARRPAMSFSHINSMDSSESRSARRSPACTANRAANDDRAASVGNCDGNRLCTGKRDQDVAALDSVCALIFHQLDSALMPLDGVLPCASLIQPVHRVAPVAHVLGVVRRQRRGGR